MEGSAATLLKNTNLVLDGYTELQSSYEVLVKGDRIVAVSQTPINDDAAKIIDVGGRTLMPGLIDAHAHITGLSLSPRNTSYPAWEIAVAAANYLHSSLMDGFTSIREAGGADQGIARLLAEGKIIGPRLFYSGVQLRRPAAGRISARPTRSMILAANQGPTPLCR